jgi:hypothetical protein
VRTTFTMHVFFSGYLVRTAVAPGFLRVEAVPVAPVVAPIASALARRNAARISAACAFKNSPGNKLAASAARLRRSLVFCHQP